MHFAFNGETYKQVNGVTMGSPLDPVLANIFMVELETSLISSLKEKVAMHYGIDTLMIRLHSSSTVRLRMN